MNIQDVLKKGEELRRNGNYEEARKLYENALGEASRDIDKALIHYGLSRVYIRIGESILAREHVNDAIKFAESSGDDDTLTKIYTSAIEINMSLGNIDTCEHLIKLGFKHAEKSKPETMFNFYNLVGIYSFDRGRIGYAKKSWERCLEISKKIGDDELIAIAYNNMGEVFRVRGEYRNAIEHYKHAYEHSKRGNDYRGMSINLLNMGDMARESGELDDAERYLREAVELYKNHEDKEIESSTLGYLAVILADRGKYDEAMKLANEAVELSKEVKNKSTIGESLLNLGYVYEKSGDYRKAMRTYNDARSIFVKINHRVFLSECELAIGRVLLESNMKEAARFHLEEAKKVAESIGEFRIMRKANELLVKC